MIRQITLNGFKSFRSATVPLGPLTLIVGTNASGKSNLRDALRCLHGIGRGLTVPELLGGKYGPGGVLEWRGLRGGAQEVGFNGARQIDLGFQMAQADTDLSYLVQIELGVDKLTGRFAHESFESSNQPYVKYAFDRLRRFTMPIPPSVHLVQRFVIAGPFISGEDLPYTEAELRKAADARRTASDALEAMRFLDLDPEAMRQTATPGVTILGDRGENLSSVLQIICDDEQQKQVLLSWVRSLTPLDVVDFEFKHDFQGRVLVFLVEANGQHTSAISASDGTLRFLALAAALLSPDSGRLYFFEELDNGIHPTRLPLLLNLIEQATRGPNPVQVIATTHNPALLAHLSPEAREHALLTFRDEGADHTRVVRILDLPAAREVLSRNDLGALHASGWLEDAAAFGPSDEARPPGAAEPDAADESVAQPQAERTIDDGAQP